MTPLMEAVTQVRGQAGARQTARHDTAIVSGNGGVLDHHATLVLGNPLDWHAVAGTATLVTWAADDGASTAPELADAAGDGEVIAIVELDEGLWLHAALPGVDRDALVAGMALRVEFLPLGGGEPVPVFVPAG